MTLTTIFAGNQAYALSFVFVFGLLWGSFLNVVIHRLPLGKSVVFPRSSCPKCATPITWFENIPLLSWLVLRGKCSHCGVRISLRYPLVELLTAILFTLVAARQPHLYSIFFQFWFIGSLIACTFIDIDHWILPDKITLPGILLGFLASFLPEELGWLNSLTGILFGGGLLY